MVRTQNNQDCRVITARAWGNYQKEMTLSKYTTESPCIICGASPSDIAHVTSRGAGGDDTPENMIYGLCRQHHTEQHAKGWSAIMRRGAAAEFAAFVGHEFRSTEQTNI